MFILIFNVLLRFLIGSRFGSQSTLEFVFKTVALMKIYDYIDIDI